MTTKHECVTAGCPQHVADALSARGLDLGKMLSIVQLVLSYIPKIQTDPKEIWNFLVAAYSILFPMPAPTPTPMPAPK